jgi:hypothetical protein
LLAVTDQFLLGKRYACLQNHARRDQFTPPRITYTKNCRFSNYRNLVNDRLDLTAVNLFSAGDDHVFQAIYDEQVPGTILVTDVSGPKEIVPEGLRGALGMVPVTKHYVRAASHDFATLSSCDLFTRRRIDYLNVGPGTRLSTGQCPDKVFWGFQTRQEARLGLCERSRFPGAPVR